jgi:hypothetical protein
MIQGVAAWQVDPFFAQITDPLLGKKKRVLLFK